MEQVHQKESLLNKTTSLLELLLAAITLLSVAIGFFVTNQIHANNESNTRRNEDNLMDIRIKTLESNYSKIDRDLEILKAGQMELLLSLKDKQDRKK